ncbi:MAG: DUF748 domain-containing protein [Thiobacillus sp.]|nr:DUF748 domain-containing protein [Thiobacillus sp.]
MLSRLRAFLANLLVKTPVRVILALVVVYFLFGWFAFEPLVKWAAPKVVADNSRHHLAIATARFDPLALSVQVKGLALKEPDGKPLLTFDELFVDFEASGLLRRAFAFSDIRLVGPDAHLVLLPDGKLNWTALIEAFKSEEEDEDKELPRLLIDRISLAKGQLHFTDHKIAQGHTTNLHDLHFQLTDLSTLPDDKGAYTLSTRMNNGARVRWKGELSLNPILATGKLALEELHLAKVWPYLKDSLNMRTPGGVAYLGFDYRAAYDNEQLSLSLDDMGFKLEGLALQGKDAAEPAVALGSLQVSGGRFDLQQRRLDIARVALQGGHVHVARRVDGSFDLTDWFRPSDDASQAEATRGGQEAVPGSPPLVSPAKGTVADLDSILPGGEVRLGGLAFAYKSTRLHPDSKPRLDKVVRAMRDKPDLRAHIGGHSDSVGSDAYNLRMSAARAESVKAYLVDKGISPERIATRGYGESRPVADNATDAGRTANRRVVLRFHLPGEDPDGPAAPGGSAAGVWTVNLGDFLLDGLGVRYRDAGFESPLGVEVGNVKVGFQAQAQAGAGIPQARVDGFGASLSGIRLTSESIHQPILVMGGINLEGGRLDLAARDASLSRLALVNGRVVAERDAQGRIPLAAAFNPAAAAGPRTTPVNNGESGGNGAGESWKYRLDAFELTGFEVAVQDRTTSPAAGLTLQQIQASLTGLSQDMGANLPLKLSLRVKEGGAFQADGKVVPAKAAADIRLKLTNLSLLPAQPYVSQAANLILASGAASASGRVKFDKQLKFDGGFRVTNLLLNESEGGARFLAWKALESDSVSYRPEALDIEELKLDGLGAKLVIYEDKTVNLKKILKPQVPPAQGPSPAPAMPRADKDAPATRMTIERVRVANGEMDFADHSLALPFGTRIHKFQGALNGISTQPGSAAQLELDGQVDEYGLARAVGQLDLFDPTAFMDIKVVFRNVEMTSLTPYTATFVGRKIASGKLSLDLEYKIKERQLLGENQIIMDKLTLGERVQNSTAKDLPLDLAIAILQDSDGRIDLGLPVSGSLDDPQFSYGRIIWKAIGNIITKIVTAPFRALASLFGGNGEKLEKLAFEPGEAGLTPPEKEKLKQIATVLNKRPGLALTVHPAWSADIDRPVVREARLRRAVAEKMGRGLGPDEEPGPVSTATPKVQAALEALYAQRVGEEAMNTLRARWLQANPDKKQESGAGKLMSRLKGLLKKEEPLSESDMSALKGTELHALLYERLLARETVTDDDLRALAGKRGKAILAGLAGAGISEARVRLGETEPFTQEGREVPARMELGVAKSLSQDTQVSSDNAEK